MDIIIIIIINYYIVVFVVVGVVVVVVVVAAAAAAAAIFVELLRRIDFSEEIFVFDFLASTFYNVFVHMKRQLSRSSKKPVDNLI